MTKLDTNSMDLNAWLCYLESIDPNKIELGLERVKVVADNMQLSSFKDKKVITVAGTNGKGSTCKFLATTLLKSGYSVGLYTSPHLINFQERININGLDIDSKLLCEALSAIYTCSKALNIKLSYFEFTTLAALYAFKALDVDFIILEVGLGGRLDAVNIVDADLAIICSIGLDHTHILGNTLEKIAFEKAGIIKKGKISVVGDIKGIALDTIIKQALAKNAMLYIQDLDFKVAFDDRNNNFVYTSYKANAINCKIASNDTYLLPKIPRACIAIALCAINILKDMGFKIAKESIDYAILHASLPCRLQKVGNSPIIYLDVSHNEPAAVNLCNFLSRQKGIRGQRIAVLAMLADKDVEAVISVVQSLFDKWYVASTDTSRGQSYERLVQAISKHVIDDNNIKGFLKIEDALDAALKDSSDDDVIVVFGSFVTASKAYIHLNLQNKNKDNFL